MLKLQDRLLNCLYSGHMTPICAHFLLFKSEHERFDLPAAVQN